MTSCEILCHLRSAFTTSRQPGVSLRHPLNCVSAKRFVFTKIQGFDKVIAFQGGLSRLIPAATQLYILYICCTTTSKKKLWRHGRRSRAGESHGFCRSKAWPPGRIPTKLVLAPWDQPRGLRPPTGAAISCVPGGPRSESVQTSDPARVGMKIRRIQTKGLEPDSETNRSDSETRVLKLGF